MNLTYYSDINKCKTKKNLIFMPNKNLEINYEISLNIFNKCIIAFGFIRL